MLSRISDIGGLEVVLDRVANGETLRMIAADLGTTRQMLGDWLGDDVERRALYQRARAASAAVFAEHALEIADQSSETGTSKARLQIETRQWLAGIYSPGEFAAKPAAVNVNIGSLHLDSLRRANAMEPDGPIQLSPLESSTIQVQSNDIKRLD